MDGSCKIPKYIVFNDYSGELVSCDTQGELALTVSEFFMSGVIPVIFKAV